MQLEYCPHLEKSHHKCIKTNFEDKIFFCSQNWFFYPKFHSWEINGDIRINLKSTSSELIRRSCISISCIIVFHNTLFIKALNKCDKTTYVPISGFLLVIRKIKPGLVLLETFRSNFEFFLTSPTARLKRIQNWISKSLVKLKFPVSFFYPRKILILVHK